MGQLQNPIKEKRQNHGTLKTQKNQRTIRNRITQKNRSPQRKISHRRSNQAPINRKTQSQRRTIKRGPNPAPKNERTRKIRRVKSQKKKSLTVQNQRVNRPKQQKCYAHHLTKKIKGKVRIRKNICLLEVKGPKRSRTCRITKVFFKITLDESRIKNKRKFRDSDNCKKRLLIDRLNLTL